MKLTLEAEPMVLAGLRHAIAHWLGGHGVEEDDCFNLTLATSEAAGNAIEHAYGESHATFSVTCECNGDEVSICVRDNGRWRNDSPYGRGRGLAIMRALVDSLDITRGDDGTTVVLSKRCAASRA
jgi:anti-sigma regulatory factor (Ser/Thr protein kinase)